MTRVSQSELPNHSTGGDREREKLIFVHKVCPVRELSTFSRNKQAFCLVHELDNEIAQYTTRAVSQIGRNICIMHRPI